MNPAYGYRCDQCSLEIRTSGPWPFYRDPQGRRWSGDPERIPEEARRKGISGLLGEVFCLHCRSCIEVVLVERTERSSAGGSAAPAIADVRWPSCCPRCGSRLLLLEPDPERDVPCPACGRGRLRGRTLANQGGCEP